MKPITAVTHYNPWPFFERNLLSLTQSSLVDRVVIVSQEPVRFERGRCRVLGAGPLSSQETLSRVLGGIRTKYLLLLPGSQQISVESKSLEKVCQNTFLRICEFD